jgi:hypothetical protein
MLLKYDDKPHWQNIRQAAQLVNNERVIKNWSKLILRAIQVGALQPIFNTGMIMNKVGA